MARYNAKGFSDEEVEYYSRQMVLNEIGSAGQLLLKRAKVCVVGLGGLGSPLSVQLASMGVGHLRVIDRDIVEISNLQRQHLYGVDVIGYPKVEAAAMRLRRLNPFVEIEPVPMSLSSENAEKLIGGVDVVVDGLDRMAPRYALNRACVKLDIPYIFGAVLTHIGNVTTIIPRKTACLECFHGGINDDSLPTCAVVGVNPSIINIVASIQASEAVKIILGRAPSLENTLLFCDLSSLAFERIALARAETCPVCGLKPKARASPIEREPVEEICGRDGRRVFIFSVVDDQHLDMKTLNDRIHELELCPDVEAVMGTSFSGSSGFKGSVLSSGVVIIEGMESRENAEKLRDKLIKIARSPPL